MGSPSRFFAAQEVPQTIDAQLAQNGLADDQFMLQQHVGEQICAQSPGGERSDQNVRKVAGMVGVSAGTFVDLPVTVGGISR